MWKTRRHFQRSEPNPSTNLSSGTDAKQTFEQCCGSGFASGSVGSLIFWPPGSATGSVSHKYGSASRSGRQRYRSEDPHPHPDPYQNVTDPQHCL
jgi:hypothetical protein